MPNFLPSTPSAVPSVKTANKTPPPTTIRFKGYLNKQKHGRCRAWLKRYFVLYGEELRYYKNKGDTNALAVISLDHYSLVPDAQPLTSLNQKQWKFHTFCLVSDDETKFDWPDYFLQAENQEERAVWVDCLQQHISQSKTVLEKWLERLEMSQDENGSQAAPSLYSRTGSDRITNRSSPTLPAAIPFDQNQTKQQQQQSFNDRISSNILLPHLQHSIRSHKSVESINAFTTRSSTVSNRIAGNNGYQRRPSDFTSSRSTDISSKLFNSKIFSWGRSTKSSTSSIASSSRSISNIHMEYNSGDLLATPTTPSKPVESPIIHPSEYNHDDDPQERITSLRRSLKATDGLKDAINDPTANFCYGQDGIHEKDTATIA